MAQIIKHRRGGVTQLKDVTARVGELVMATGSINDLNGPFLFIGETEGVQGAYRAASKIYQGSNAPTLTLGSHGSVLDGTPFYASGNESLYILSQAGNTRLDLSGNIEDRVISNVTINQLSGSTKVLGNVDITNNLAVTGSTTFNGSVTVTGLTENRLVVVGVGGLLEDDANLTFDGTKFDIGQGQFQVDTATGDIRTSGSIIMKGDITIGDQNTDNIILAGEVSSSIIPDVNNAFDLGSATQAWRNLHVSGTAYIETLAAGTLSLSGITVFEDLVVEGNTVLGNSTGDTVNITGSVYLDSLTDNRVVIVGADGLLEDDANFTFDGTELNVGQGNFTVQQSSGNVSISGSTTASGSVQLLTTLNVDGQSTLASVNVEDLTDNRIVIVGTNGELEDDANFTFNGTQLNIGVGNFTVQQSSGDIDTQGTLNVGGATTLESSLDVTGSANFKSNVIISGTTTISGNTYVEYLTDNRVLLAGPNGHIEDDGNLTFDGSVLKIGVGQFEVDVADGDIRTSGSLTVEGGITINGDETINGNLTVTGNTFINSNLYVSGNVEFLASASYVHISSSVIELDDNIIRLNAYSPFERYAGFEVIDSGSSNTSASLVWDSLNDYWMFVSSSGQSSKLIGTTAGTYGSEISLTTNTIPKSTGANTIGDSLLTDNGTTLAYNTNKFIVTGSTGETLIYGNVTLSAAGGTDAGTNSSAIVFRNSSNVLGYISTTVSTVETNGLLGYRQSNGSLIFSDLIDGGTY